MGLVEEDLEPSSRARIYDFGSSGGYWTSRVMEGINRIIG
jgi:hypothetical protein